MRYAKFVSVAACVCFGVVLANLFGFQTRPSTTPQIPAPGMPTPSPGAKPVDSNELSPEIKDILKEAMKKSSPTEKHQALDPLVGSFTVTTTWMNPTGTVLTLQGSSENTWLMGKRFLQCDSIIGGGDTTFEGRTTLGYDTKADEYFWFGFDALGTQYILARGSHDETTKAIVFKGELANPDSGKKYNFRLNLHIDSKDAYHTEFYVEVPNMQAVKMTESMYKRKSKDADPASKQR